MSSGGGCLRFDDGHEGAEAGHESRMDPQVAAEVERATWPRRAAHLQPAHRRRGASRKTRVAEGHMRHKQQQQQHARRMRACVMHASSLIVERAYRTGAEDAGAVRDP